MKRLLKFAACLAFAPFFMLSCEEQEPIAEETNTLEVTPSDPISFLASGNAAVTLTVTTDADSWDSSPPLNGSRPLRRRTPFQSMPRTTPRHRGSAVSNSLPAMQSLSLSL